MSWRTAQHRRGRHHALSSGSVVVRGVAALAAVLTLGACDFPTEPPKLQPRFILPGQSTTLSLTQILPSGVTEVGTSFQLSIAPTAITARTLAEICGAPCVALHGQRVPKPAFTYVLDTPVPLPADVASAVLTAGSVNVSLTHSFGFDPLRPPGAAQNGTLTLALLAGETVLGSVVVTDPFPSGTTLQRTVTVAPGTITGDLTVRLTLDSPAGGTAEAHWVLVDANSVLSGTVAPGPITVSEATVRVQDKSVSVTDFQIDMSGVDQSLRGRVRSGALVITADNPFGVTGTMQLRMIGGTGEIIMPRTLQVQPGRTTQRVEFTQDELGLILQSTVTIRIAGAVSGQQGLVTVRPGQVLTIDTQLDLTIEIG
jgi:hypothetical protein